MPSLISSIKTAATQAVDEGKPVQIVFGVVSREEPLQIVIEQKLTLERENLTLARGVTDYDIEVGVSWETQSEEQAHKHLVPSLGEQSDEQDARHTHAITGRKTLTVYGALKAGEAVAMLRMQGGQKYLVLDRVVG